MPIPIDLKSVAAALRAGIPARPLTTVRLPMIVCSTGATVHSYDDGRSCGELRLWGGRDGKTVERITLAELAARTFVNDTPEANICGTCLGDDLDLVDTCAEMVRSIRHVVCVQEPKHLVLLRKAASAGGHRLDATDRTQTEAWRSLARMRGSWETQLHQVYTAVVHEKAIRDAAEFDPDLAAWYRRQVETYTAAITGHVRLMAHDRDLDDRDRGIVPGPLELVAPYADRGRIRWSDLTAATGRWVYTSDPVEILRLDGRIVPVFAIPEDERVRATGELVHLGPADRHLGPGLEEMLRLTERIYANMTTPDLADAFGSAVAVAAPAHA